MIVLNKRVLKSVSEKSDTIPILFDKHNFKEYFKESNGNLNRVIPKSNFEKFVKYYNETDINISFKELPTEAKKDSYLFSFFETIILSRKILEDCIYDTYTSIEHLKKKYNNFTINIDIPEFDFKLKAKFNNVQYNLSRNTIEFYFNSEVSYIDIIKNIEKSPVFIYESSSDTQLNTQQIFFESSYFSTLFQLNFVKKFLPPSEPNISKEKQSNQNFFASFILYIEKEKLSEDEFKKELSKDDYFVFFKEDFKTIEEVINNIQYLLKNNITLFFKIYNIINNNDLFSLKTSKVTFPEFEFDDKNNAIEFIFKYSFFDLPVTLIPRLCISIQFKIPQRIKVFEKNSEKQYKLPDIYCRDIDDDEKLFKKLFGHFSNYEFNCYNNVDVVSIQLIIEGDKFLKKPLLYIYTEKEIKEIIKNIFYLILKKNEII